MIVELQGQKLTPQDGRVLEGLWRGLSNKEIAKRLKIEPRTVKMHIWRLARTFNIDTSRYWPRVRLCYFVGLERGLLTPLIASTGFSESVSLKRISKRKPTSH